jgi:hypothetical protein
MIEILKNFVVIFVNNNGTSGKVNISFVICVIKNQLIYHMYKFVFDEMKAKKKYI